MNEAAARLTKGLVLAGIPLAGFGAALHFASYFLGAGKLDGGGFNFQKEGFSFFFPLTACLTASLILTLLLNLFRGVR